MRNLISLVYCSKMSDFARRLDEEVRLAGILSVARANNSRRGITGALLCGAGFFAQVLEGECDLVGATMAAIEADARHEEVNILQVRSVAHREFKGWTMADASVPMAGGSLEGTLTSMLLARAHAGRVSLAGAVHGLLRTSAAADPSWSMPLPAPRGTMFSPIGGRAVLAPGMT